MREHETMCMMMERVELHPQKFALKTIYAQECACFVHEFIIKNVIILEAKRIAKERNFLSLFIVQLLSSTCNGCEQQLE
jgi:hypothetical protein